MPKQKKRAKGAGRPCGAYSEMSEEEKKEYHKRATQTSRGTTGTSSKDESSSVGPKPVGRPPLIESAMSPNTLKHRKCQLTNEKRRKETVSKIRQKAANVRWQIQNMDDESEVVSHLKTHEKTGEAPQTNLDQTVFRVRAQF